MTSLALAVACGLTIGMIFKVAALAGLDRISLLTVNYGTAFLMSAIAVFAGAPSFSPSTGLVVLGLITGVLFIAGFFMLALATAVAGMSLAIAVMRLSVVIPFLASWAVWSENPSGPQLGGLVIGGIAFFLITRGRSSPSPAVVEVDVPWKGTKSVFLVLAALFLVGGAIDTMLKTFDEVFANDYGRAGFMTMVFGVACLTGSVIIAARREGMPGAAAVGWGVLLGAVNFASVEFILRAIGQLSGPFVFPANNIALVIGGALLGVMIWNERLSALNWIGIALASAALVLLNF